MPSIWTRPAVAIGWKQPTLVYPVRLTSWAQEEPESITETGWPPSWERLRTGSCAH